MITYINPVIALALGVTLLGERPGAGAIAGLLLILAGSWLSTGGRLPPVLRRPGPTALSAPGAPGRARAAPAGCEQLPHAAAATERGRLTGC